MIVLRRICSNKVSHCEPASHFYRSCLLWGFLWSRGWINWMEQFRMNVRCSLINIITSTTKYQVLSPLWFEHYWFMTTESSELTGIHLRFFRHLPPLAEEESLEIGLAGQSLLYDNIERSFSLPFLLYVLKITDKTRRRRYTKRESEKRNQREMTNTYTYERSFLFFHI